MQDFTTLSQATKYLKEEKGYTEDFDLKADSIACTQNGKKYDPTQFEVDDIYRFEGMTDPGDNTILFAITTSDGTKGQLVDGYGTYSDPLTRDMVQKLKRDPKESLRS
jgi:tRNA A37 threonylcarbamoyladenosine dehydratase